MPFIVRWPGKVPPGTVSEQVVCTTDVLATLSGILGVALKPGQAEDSFDVREAFFASPGKPVRDHVILQSAEATYAIRVGDWKFIERENPPPVPARNKKAARKKGPTRDELFDLAKDPGETKDLRAEHPEVVARLRKMLADARQRGHTR